MKFPKSLHAEGWDQHFSDSPAVRPQASSGSRYLHRHDRMEASGLAEDGSAVPARSEEKAEARVRAAQVVRAETRADTPERVGSMRIESAAGSGGRGGIGRGSEGRGSASSPRGRNGRQTKAVSWVVGLGATAALATLGITTMNRHAAPDELAQAAQELPLPSSEPTLESKAPTTTVAQQETPSDEVTANPTEALTAQGDARVGQQNQTLDHLPATSAGPVGATQQSGMAGVAQRSASPSPSQATASTEPHSTAGATAATTSKSANSGASTSLTAMAPTSGKTQGEEVKPDSKPATPPENLALAGSGKSAVPAPKLAQSPVGAQRPTVSASASEPVVATLAEAPAVSEVKPLTPERMASEASAPAPESDDLGISRLVRQALAADPVLSHSPIQVTTLQGQVRLDGEVPDAAAKSRASWLASAPAGVRGVDNRLVVPGAVVSMTTMPLQAPAH